MFFSEQNANKNLSAFYSKNHCVSLSFSHKLTFSYVVSIFYPRLLFVLTISSNFFKSQNTKKLFNLSSFEAFKLYYLALS